MAKEVTGKDIVKNLLKYCWPRGRSSEERAVKCSLITSLLLMVASKVTIRYKSTFKTLVVGVSSSNV